MKSDLYKTASGYKSLGGHALSGIPSTTTVKDNPFRESEYSGKDLHYFRVICQKGELSPVTYYHEVAVNPGTSPNDVIKAAVAPFVPEKYKIVGGVESSIFKTDNDKWIPYQPKSRYARTVYHRVSLMELTKEEYIKLAPNE